ncbi:MAG TPA: hypothetical protein VMU50_01365, partial [Polyangia bacterium]|nr:hypothetical protein [Polyangia bacterium]
SGAMVGIPAAMNLASVTAAAYKMVYLDPDNLDFYQGPNDKLVNDVTPGNPDAPLDYTGLKRKATNDWGAMELPATIHTWPWAGAAMIGAGAVPTMEIPPGASIDAGAVNDAPAGGMSGAGGSGGMSSAGGDAGSGAGGNAGSAGNGSGGGMTGAAGGARGGASSSGGGCSTGGEPVTGSSIAFFALILTSALLWLAHRRRA